MTVPPELTTVLITATDAPAAVDGFVSPVTMHTTAAFKAAAVASVIWRVLEPKLGTVVVDTGASAPAFVQVAAGVPVNVGKPVTEIKATFVASAPVKLTVKVATADFTLLLNAVEAEAAV